MTKNPTVSVILPVHDTCEYLPRCLDSLLAQTYADFEILAIDDESTDGSLAVLRQYAARDPRIRIWRSSGGVAAARNTGLRHMRGRWLMFCDSDDWTEPLWIQTLLEAVSAGGADMAVCDCFVEKEHRHGRSAGAVGYTRVREKGMLPFRLARAKINRLLWNKIFNAQRVRREEISFPTGREHDDNAFVFMYLCSQDKQVSMLGGKRLYHYVLRENSLMGRLFHGRHKGHLFDQIYAKRFVMDWLLRRGLWTELAEDFLADLNDGIYFCCQALRKEADKKRLPVLVWELFEKTPVPAVRLSPLMQAVLKKDFAEAGRLLRQGDETERKVRLAGVTLLRTVCGWCWKKVFVLGVGVYKKDPFYLGGRRFIFGLPLGRRKFK